MLDNFLNLIFSLQLLPIIIANIYIGIYFSIQGYCHNGDNMGMSASISGQSLARIA